MRPEDSQPPELRSAGAAGQPLAGPWRLSVVPAGEQPLQWLPARVPGTAAAALRDAGLPMPPDLDELDCWFRTSFASRPAEPGERVALCLAGIATVAEVTLNGERVAGVDSMFAGQELDVTSLVRAQNELVIRCRALSSADAGRKPRPRWRTKLAPSSLRSRRTMLLGRCPGFAPGPAAVGPWRPVSLRRGRGSSLRARVSPRLEGTDGLVSVDADVETTDGLAPATVEVEAPGHGVVASAPVVDGLAHVELRLPRAETWWPHTHGAPVLHELVVRAGDATLCRRVGFRTLSPGPEYDVEESPLALAVNGVPVFVRGVVWTPPDFVRLATSEADLRRALTRVRDAGLNMVRLPGTGAYESSAFHDLCDELGLLVWQDLMFANFDYPFGDDEFRAAAEAEARQELGALAGRPSLTVVCGNSECEQQAAMLGLDPATTFEPFFRETVPAIVRECGLDAVYVPSAPSGGSLPFRFDRGVSNYFGVGGYRQGLGDLRRANVGFASECLAIANVPEQATLEEDGLDRSPVHDPRWKAGVPRDADASWDFDDVRDWYLRELFGVDPAELRRTDRDLYLDLSRATSGELMAEAFGDWRRASSSCAGALVLWLHDLVPGAGWGIVDSHGRPKAPLDHLRRVLRPLAVWTTDEGLGGVAVHLANDGPEPFHGRVSVRLYRDELRVEEAERAVSLGPHSLLELDAEAIIGRFVDASWSYRFGPPGHTVLVATLTGPEGTPLSRSVRFVAGRPTRREAAGGLGLAAAATRVADGVRVELTTRRLAYGVRVAAPGWEADESWFSLEPGGTCSVLLRSEAPAAPFAGVVRAVNLDGTLPVQLQDAPGRL